MPGQRGTRGGAATEAQRLALLLPAWV